jgi:DNA invertase Pin-like site-specific DNA recombinase
MARLAVYLRRSSPGEENKNYSISNQQDDIEKWPEYHHHTLVQTYSDPGGKSYTLNRPVFQRLMTDAKAGLFDLVVVGKWDRFSRMQDQQAVAIYQLQQYRVKVVSATEPIPDGPMGTRVRGNFAFASEQELYNIRERTTNGKRKRVHTGKLPPKPYPLYGYLFADWATKERYIIDPETAPVVERIYHYLLDGMTMLRIARELDAAQIPTPRAVLALRGQLPKNWGVIEKWSASTIHRILTHPAYCGRLVGWGIQTTTTERIHKVTGEVEVKRVQLARPEDDPDRIVFDESVCPAIVSVATWQAAQDQLARNKQQAPRRLRDPEAILLRNGFALCGVCGRSLQGSWHEPSKFWRYTCKKKHVSRYTHDLDKIVWDWVVFKFSNPDVIRKKYQQWLAERDTRTSMERDRLVALSTAYDVAEKRRKNYMRLAGDEDDIAQAEEYRLLAKEAAESARDLSDQTEQLNVLLSQQEQQQALMEALVSATERKSANLANANFNYKRQLLYYFQVKITVHHATDDPPYDIRWELDNQYVRKFEEEEKGPNLDFTATNG